MKITADMLTEEYGFIPGVIIMVETETGFISTDILRKVGRESILYAQCEIPGNPGYIHGYHPFDYIVSIKPLTGPISIWNHAPKWANYVEIFIDGISWYSDADITETITKRPWWA